MKRLAAVLVTAGLAATLAASTRAADAQVAGLQVALQARGLYRGAVDGIAGPQTRHAVIVFQRRAGLVVDGVAGPRTRAALGPLGRPRLGRRLLVRGRLGWDVSVLQFLLRKRGFDPGPLDGYMGPGTVEALLDFQRSAGLLPDGVVGPATLGALGRGGPRRAFVPVSAHTGTTVVVHPGDTLSDLAARHGTTVSALARANHLNPRGILFVGAVLRVPAATVAGTGAVRELIDRWARHYGVDPALVRALAWMESGFQTNLTSSVGAWGVMQIIPDTWKFVETVLTGERIPRTPEGNIRVGVLYLRHLLRRFNGNERLALAGWYQGERAVRQHGAYKESKWFAKVVLALRRRGA